jgi:Ca2+/H+ antiporter, TMEM165/GDT1 family
MKFRRRPSPLLLLLLPSLATVLVAAAQDGTKSTLSKAAQPRDTKIETNPSPIVDLNTKSKYDIGTKDAPVDGKDGKPHAGPFVGSEKDSKKSKDKPKVTSEDGELVLGKEEYADLKAPDGGKIPPVNDGVMDDPNRELPKQGTTGTEGGVSEKDKARKAKEGQTGEKLEKKPDSPKEAPPMPVSEQAKLKNEKTKAKDADDDDEDIGGLEVSLLEHYILNWANLRNRNQTTFRANLITFHIHSRIPPTKTI